MTACSPPTPRSACWACSWRGSASTFLGYAAIFWGLDGGTSATVALELSGSSLFTLGFLRPTTFWLMMVSFIEAGIGLFLLALLITYLPSIYAAFSRREHGVTALEVRAGSPPSGPSWSALLGAPADGGAERRLGGVGALVRRRRGDAHVVPAARRSSAPRRPTTHWVTAAGAVLDGAALAVSTVDVEHDVQADFCIRAGYLCLRRIADVLHRADREPAPGDPISITRQEWDDAIDDLAAAGVPIKADRDQAWRDFAGWRVNYDAVLLALADLTTLRTRCGRRTAGARPIRPKLYGGSGLLNTMSSTTRTSTA